MSRRNSKDVSGKHTLPTPHSRDHRRMSMASVHGRGKLLLTN